MAARLPDGARKFACVSEPRGRMLRRSIWRESFCGIPATALSLSRLAFRTQLDVQSVALRHLIGLPIRTYRK